MRVLAAISFGVALGCAPSIEPQGPAWLVELEAMPESELEEPEERELEEPEAPGFATDDYLYQLAAEGEAPRRVCDDARLLYCKQIWPDTRRRDTAIVDENRPRTRVSITDVQISGWDRQGDFDQQIRTQLERGRFVLSGCWSMRATGGEVHVELVIGANGFPLGEVQVTSTLADSSFETCIADKLSALEYPNQHGPNPLKVELRVHPR